jgi:LysM repeat protein
VAIIAVAAILGYFYFYGNVPWQAAQEDLSGPSVAIQEPLSGTQVAQGDSFLLFATAHDSLGVVRIDLWSDDTLVLSQSSPEDSGITPLTLMYPLAAVRTGSYALIARAYNIHGEFGESLVHYVTVSEVAASKQVSVEYKVQEGDTLESIADKAGVDPQSIQQANPHLQVGEVKPDQNINIKMPPRSGAKVAQPNDNQGGDSDKKKWDGPGIAPVHLDSGQGQALDLPPGAIVDFISPSVFPNLQDMLDPLAAHKPVPTPDPPEAKVSAPASVKASASDANCTITVTWTDIANNESGYQVSRYEFGKPNPITVADDLKPDTDSYTDSLPKMGKYGYRIMAFIEQKGKKRFAPSQMVWVELLSSEKCQVLPEFKQIYFQPITFKPTDSSLTHGHLKTSIWPLPSFRIPRGKQINLPIGDWSARNPIFSPAPPSIYENTGASLKLEFHGAATSDPGKVPPKPLGQFSDHITAADLTDPDASKNVRYGKGEGFELWYKFWLEDWLWNGKASNSSNSTLPAPYNVHVYDKPEFGDRSALSWDYDKKYQDDLDGFIIYRQFNCPAGDVKIQYPLVASPELRYIGFLNEPVGCDCAYEVSAFGKGGESKRVGPPSTESCITERPTDAAEVTFKSVSIRGNLGWGYTGQVTIAANEIVRTSNWQRIEGDKVYQLNEFHFNGKRPNNSMFVVLKGGTSLAVKLDFHITDMCSGSLTIKKLDFTWKGSEGDYTIKSADGDCKVVVSFQGSATEKQGATPLGGNCNYDGWSCVSNYCYFGVCAPQGKGDEGDYCFANKHCLSGVCDCLEDNKLVPCGPPRPGMGGTCGKGYGMGEFCNGDNDCASNYCANGQCAPKNGTGQYREYCHHNDHCATGLCYCPEGYGLGGFCKNHDSLAEEDYGYCTYRGDKVKGTKCSENSDCESNHCADGLCAPRNKTGLSGDYCHHNDHCYSKVCDCIKIMGGGLCIDYNNSTPLKYATCLP